VTAPIDRFGVQAMRVQTKGEERSSAKEASPPRPTKKDQILALFRSGIGDVADIALMTGSRPSYVGSVLQHAEQHGGYFDLYTSTARPMNVYSKFFTGQLGFKDVETARQSVAVIDRLYRQFEIAGDRAGQHHALLMALTMFDRARWTNKGDEAEVFRAWLAERLGEAAPHAAAPATATALGPRPLAPPGEHPEESARRSKRGFIDGPVGSE